ncbi:MAG: magnesium transporter [Deltaproteobacteria bacterium]|nr:magnesium transporter [Deltaproteobacteria bacterium]
MASSRAPTDLIHALLREGDERRLRRALTRQDDVQLGSQLDNLALAEQERILRLLPGDRRPRVLSQMRYEAAATLVAHFAPEEAAALLDDLHPDDVVDILGRVDDERLAQILARLDRDDADELEELLAYDEHTAGGIMSPDFLTVPPGETVAEALARLQALAEMPTHAYYVYVVDDGGKLVGVCSFRQFVVHRPHECVRDFMQAEVVSVRAETDQEEVADIVSRYDLVALPVVDAHNVLIGVVTVDDVVDVIREEATEDILKMAGAGEELAEARLFWSSLRARWRWLMAAAAGGTVAAASLSGFDAALAKVPALAFFMPVVAGMGGNVGMQSSTIVVRGLAVGFIESARVRRLVTREVSLGASLGLVYGLLIGLAAVMVGSDVAEPWRLGLTVAGGCAGSMTLAALVGTSTPLVLDRIGVDPAIATGPFVTTSVDVMGLLFYFWLAKMLLGLGAG